MAAWDTASVVFRGIGVEIDVIPVDGDQLAHSEASVRQQRDYRVIAPLQVIRERIGEVGIPAPFDLLGSKLGRSLFLGRGLRA